MRIKSRLQIASIVPTFFAVAAAVFLWTTQNQIERGHDQSDIAKEIGLKVVDQLVLLQEYLMYGGERAAIQLKLRHQQKGEAILRLQADNPEDRATIAAMREGHDEIGGLLDLLFSEEIADKRLVAGNILVRVEEMRGRALRLDLMLHERVVRQQEALAIFMMVAIVLVALVSIVVLWEAGRRLVKGMETLNAGMSRIGQGDLQHKLDVSGDDELAELARQFNNMTDRLEATSEALKHSNASLLHRSAELEMANKDLEGFSYSVSHDLRAPLRAIDGFIAIIDEDYGPAMDAEAKRLFGIVQSNARKMGDLIDDILAFSRAGRLEITLERVDMNTLVDEVWIALSEDRHGREIEFSRGDLPSVVADPRALRQVWQNLLSNAIKFTRTRTLAQIRVESRHSAEGAIEYSVTDNGVGFNPDYVGKLFVLFQRLHGMDEFEGTGVGLCLVKRFIQKHQGKVVAESVLGAGATFRFQLPDIPLPDLAPRPDNTEV